MSDPVPSILAWSALPQWRRDYAIEEIEESAAEWERAAKTIPAAFVASPDGGKDHCLNCAIALRLAVKILEEVTKK